MSCLDTGSGPLTVLLETWHMASPSTTLSDLVLNRTYPRLQIKGIIGTGAPDSDTTILLHDGFFWLEAMVADRWKTDIHRQHIEVHDVIDVVETRGGTRNLMIVSMHWHRS